MYDFLWRDGMSVVGRSSEQSTLYSSIRVRASVMDKN